MTAKGRFVTDAQLVIIGRRYGSDAVALEAAGTITRWKRDVAVLATYGFGQKVLDVFVGDFNQHASLRATRPDGVAEKMSAVTDRDQTVSRAWAWVDKVAAILGVLARLDQRLSNALAAATPSNDAGLEAGIRALATILADSKQLLTPDAQVDQRLKEVEDLVNALQASPGAVRASKGQAKTDTAEIDLWDGRLWVRMRDLNAAARAAIRNGDLRASMSEYSFRHLKHSGNPEPAPAPSPTPANAGGLTAGHELSALNEK